MIFFLYLVQGAVFGTFSAILAAKRGRSSFGWFMCGLFFGPLGLLVLAFDPIESEEAKRASLNAAERLLPKRIELPVSLADEIRKLAELRKDGILTDSEFDQRKAILLSSGTETHKQDAEFHSASGKAGKKLYEKTCQVCSTTIPADTENCPKCSAETKLPRDIAETRKLRLSGKASLASTSQKLSSIPATAAALLILAAMGIAISLSLLKANSSDKAAAATWIGDTENRIYFLDNCTQAKELPVSRSRVFDSEEHAKSLGYTKSPQPGC